MLHHGSKFPGGVVAGGAAGAPVHGPRHAPPHVRRVGLRPLREPLPAHGAEEGRQQRAVPRPLVLPLLGEAGEGEPAVGVAAVEHRPRARPVLQRRVGQQQAVVRGLEITLGTLVCGASDPLPLYTQLLNSLLPRIDFWLREQPNKS